MNCKYWLILWHSHRWKMRSAFSLQMRYRETLTWGVGWPVFQKHPGLSLQEAPQGYPPRHPLLPPQSHRMQVVGVAESSKVPLLSSLTPCVAWKEAGGWRRVQDRTHGLIERGGRRLCFDRPGRASSKDDRLRGRMKSLLGSLSILHPHFMLFTFLLYLQEHFEEQHDFWSGSV